MRRLQSLTDKTTGPYEICVLIGSSGAPFAKRLFYGPQGLSRATTFYGSSGFGPRRSEDLGFFAATGVSWRPAGARNA